MIPTPAPRAHTPEEVRAQLLSQVRGMAKFWAELPGKTSQERCDGLAFSLLNIFDGTHTGLPAMDISLAPHPDDKAYCQRTGENWFEPGQVINDCYLHEEYYRAPADAQAEVEGR